MLSKDRRREAQGRKGSRPQGHKQQALKLGPGLKVQGGWARKAASRKVPYRGPRVKFRGARIGRLDEDKGIGGMFHVERNLVW